MRGLVDLRLPLIVFDGAATDRPSWRQFSAALVRQGIQPVVRPRFFVERLQLATDWQTFLAGRSRGLRRQIRRVRGRAEAAGTLRLQVLAGLSTAAVAKWLRIGLEIEDRGWKGRAASSVLKSPGMFDFYLEQARRAALWGQLRLVFLELDGVPIAFEYGWLSKGIYFSPKVAYDEAYAQLSPGQLLRAELVERFHADRSCESIDYLGPSSRATADWSTERYPVARVLDSDHPDRPHRPGGLRNAAANLATTHRPACSRPASIDRGRARGAGGLPRRAGWRCRRLTRPLPAFNAGRFALPGAAPER